MLRKTLLSLRPPKKILLLIAAVAALTAIGHVMIAQWLITSGTVNVPSIGTIHVWGIEAYGGDLKTINGTSTIDWGTLYIGESHNVSFTVKSKSNMPIEIAFRIVRLSPEGLSRYITLKWNYNCTFLLPQEQRQINFTLSLSNSTDTINYIVANKITAFNLDIDIYAPGSNP